MSTIKKIQWEWMNGARKVSEQSERYTQQQWDSTKENDRERCICFEGKPSVPLIMKYYDTAKQGSEIVLRSRDGIHTHAEFEDYMGEIENREFKPEGR